MTGQDQFSSVDVGINVSCFWQQMKFAPAIIYLGNKKSRISTTIAANTKHYQLKDFNVPHCCLDQQDKS